MSGDYCRDEREKQVYDAEAKSSEKEADKAEIRTDEASQGQP